MEVNEQVTQFVQEWLTQNGLTINSVLSDEQIRSVLTQVHAQFPDVEGLDEEDIEGIIDNSIIYFDGEGEIVGRRFTITGETRIVISNQVEEFLFCTKVSTYNSYISDEECVSRYGEIYNTLSNGEKLAVKEADWFNSAIENNFSNVSQGDIDNYCERMGKTEDSLTWGEKAALTMGANPDMFNAFSGYVPYDWSNYSKIMYEDAVREGQLKANEYKRDLAWKTFLEARESFNNAMEYFSKSLDMFVENSKQWVLSFKGTKYEKMMSDALQRIKNCSNMIGKYLDYNSYVELATSTLNNLAEGNDYETATGLVEFGVKGLGPLGYVAWEYLGGEGSLGMGLLLCT